MDCEVRIVANHGLPRSRHHRVISLIWLTTPPSLTAPLVPTTLTPVCRGCLRLLQTAYRDSKGYFRVGDLFIQVFPYLSTIAAIVSKAKNKNNSTNFSQTPITVHSITPFIIRYNFYGYKNSRRHFVTENIKPFRKNYIQYRICIRCHVL
jgi:hypothetical protein